MKNPLTLAGIEPAAFRLVAQHLNHCATAVPTDDVMLTYKKGERRFRTGHEGTEEENSYSSTLSLTSAPDGGGWLRLRPTALPPRITRYPFYRRLGGPWGRSEQVRNISSSPAFDSRTVQSVGSRYTDATFPAHDADIFLNKIH